MKNGNTAGGQGVFGGSNTSNVDMEGQSKVNSKNSSYVLGNPWMRLSSLSSNNVSGGLPSQSRQMQNVQMPLPPNN